MIVRIDQTTDIDHTCEYWTNVGERLSDKGIRQEQKFARILSKLSCVYGHAEKKVRKMVVIFQTESLKNTQGLGLTLFSLPWEIDTFKEKEGSPLHHLSIRIEARHRPSVPIKK